eukprot:TRINITY_DN57421_c0_g2_i1.p1 TRINITY_DN57421_c0_g2~~TRINITY_DN57421_c0_g2_i1.p1  ORF type:complete len:549 (-),score=57.81 TRINITY_DN57421_c0_g2_i1:297-1943(-)
MPPTLPKRSQSSLGKLPKLTNDKPKRPGTHLGFTSNSPDDDSQDDANITSAITAVGRLEEYEKLLAAGRSINTIDMHSLSVMPGLLTSVVELYNLQQDYIVNINLASNPGLGDSSKKLLRSIQGAPKLRYLNLSRTGMSNDALLTLCDILPTSQTLQVLLLNANKLTDMGAEALATAMKANTSITSLSLNKNKLWDSGACALASMLDTNETLKRLELATCVIADKGAVYIGMALAAQTTLSELNLSRNTISEDAVTGFADILAKNTTLVKIGITGGSVFAHNKLSKLTHRNANLQGDNVPRVLEGELNRLYVQTHKLQTAKRTLREHQQQTLAYNDMENKVENEFVVEKEDVSKQAKKVTEYIIYETTVAQELRRKAVDMKEQSEKDKVAAQNEITSLTQRYEQEIVTRTEREKEAHQLQKEFDIVESKHKAKRAEHDAQIRKVQEERDKHLADLAEKREKINAIKKLVEELKAKAMGEDDEEGAAAPPAKEATLGDFFGQATNSTPSSAGGTGEETEGGGRRKSKSKKGRKRSSAASSVAAPEETEG